MFYLRAFINTDDSKRSKFSISINKTLNHGSPFPRLGRPGKTLRPVQERRLPLRQMALRPQDQHKHTLLPGDTRKRQRLGTLRLHLSGEPHRPHCRTGSFARRHPRPRQGTESHRDRSGLRLQGPERPPRVSGGDAAETEHGDGWAVACRQIQPGGCGQGYGYCFVTYGTARGARNYFLVRRTERGGGFG